MGWVLSYSGFSNLTDRLRNVPGDSFALLMLPSLFFWVFATARIAAAVHFSKAGAVTFNNTFPVPQLYRPFSEKEKARHREEKQRYDLQNKLENFDLFLKYNMKGNRFSNSDQIRYAYHIDKLSVGDLTLLSSVELEKLRDDMNRVPVNKIADASQIEKIRSFHERVEMQIKILSSEKDALEDDTQSSS